MLKTNESEMLNVPTLISSDTTWTTGQTINLTDDVQIAAGVTLNVEAGATVHGNGHSIASFGTLSVTGTSEVSAYFENVDFTFGSDFSSQGRIEINHATILGGSFLPATGNASYGAFELTNSVLSGLGSAYIWYPTSDSIISGNVFLNSGGLSVGTREVVQIHDNAFINSDAAINGTATIVVWASYGEPVEISGNSFLGDIPALEVTIDGRAIASGGNYFGTTDPTALAALILDKNDDLSRPSIIEYGIPATGTNEVVTQALIAAEDFVASALASRGIFLGTSAGDTLVGTSEADMIIGAGGNDTLDGGFGADTLLGGSGDDLITFSSVAVRYPPPTDIGLIDGGEGTDVLDLSNISPASVHIITDTDGSYSFGARVGNQEYAVTGIETVILGGNSSLIQTILAGSITIYAGGGDDDISITLRENDIQTVYGEDGDDSFNISLGSRNSSAILDGGSGVNTLETSIGFNVDLENGTAAFAGSSSGYSSYFLRNFDNVVTPAWQGYLSSIHGDAENNSLSVNEYSDDGSVGVYFDGRGGNDILSGSAGNDTLIGGTGADVLSGGAGIDTASYATSTTGLTVRLDGTGSTGDALGDTFDSIENLIGSDYDDLLVGNSGANVLEGGNGNDTLIGGAGADVMFGQNGIDTVTYANSESGIGARLDGIVGWGGAAGDTIFQVENLIGSAYRDTLVGSNAANVIDAGAGGGTIYGLGGDDTLIGGTGADVMYGQSGADMFVFSDGFGNDTIADFEVTNLLEVIDLSNISAIVDFGDLRDNHINQIGADVLIDDLAGNTITLSGIVLTELLDSNSFVF